MRHLCDVNVFIALAVGDHARHGETRAWFEGLSGGDVAAFCRATQTSFLRLLTQRIAPGYTPVSNHEAISVYQQLLSDDCVDWIREPVGIDSHWPRFAEADTAAPKRWMDAYLAAFAVASGVRFVTLDRGFRQFEAVGLDLLLLGDGARAGDAIV